MAGTGTTTVQTTYGEVSGLIEGDIARFLGIPYAAAPTGANRFAPPVPPEPWEGVRPAHEFGPRAPRPVGGPYDALLGGREPVDSEEGWLNLNVWAPANVPVFLPVMVWIHGGAFLRGSSAGTAYDGAGFARDGVVCVSVNYRLGVEGFGYIADAPAPANRGLLDLIFALEWVRENIAQFGGDPGNVTLVGESAGAMSILTLLSTDRGLCHKAIVQSGSAHATQSTDDAELVIKEIAKELGVTANYEALSQVAPSDIVTAQTTVHERIVQSADPHKYGRSTIDSCGMSLMPVIDGELLTRRPIDAIAFDGAGGDIPLLIGTNTEEHRYFALSAPSDTTPQAWKERLAVYGVPDSGDLYDQYASRATRAYPRESPAEVFAAVMTDRLFRIPSYRVAEARAGAGGGAATYVYEFGWRTPKARTGSAALGACHVAEIPFVWQTLEAPGVDELLTDPPQDLAEAMHSAWIEFMRTGELAQWSHYNTAERPVMTFHRDNKPVNETVPDPRSDERKLWDGALDPE
ncbi:carboxylesterase family protein [Streptomyces sp. NPDC000151]|uniref:carboxylesterase/lipase family protein n=1 Tax=Streptomyces sp. NPDC000151 TaxID=3154244 RepID=UPI0033169649